MKAITLRNVPEDLAAMIEAEAKRTGASLNATVIRLLQQATAVDIPATKPEPQTYHDLDFLIGSWTKEEADEFDHHLEEARRIDMELTCMEWQREDTAK